LFSAAAAEIALHHFAPPPTGGADPQAGVIRDAAGNLYGTASSGGTGGWGVVYELDASGAYKVLYNFTGGADGGTPIARLWLDSAGNLYGTTSQGGTANAGVVYKLDPAGNETVLYSFSGGADGGYPTAGVILDSAGNLYGTAEFGGGPANAGVVYKLDPAGNETVLHTFTGADGAYPYAGVIRDAAGYLYGTTQLGGSRNQGVVYKVDPAGHETVLYRFTGGADGGFPLTGVIQRDAAGNLYGTTQYGGTANAGVVYKLDLTGHQTLLYTFTGGADGGNPQAEVVGDFEGNLYGTTYHGGYRGYGAVYKLDPAGNQTVLHSFTSTQASPTAGVIRDSATGDLYGTASTGGGGGGMVYKLDATGHETVLHSFGAVPGGSKPDAGVIRDASDNLYGTTTSGGARGFGVVYKLDPSGHETVLHNFTGGADGGVPYAGVIRDAAGNLYGTTALGGTVGNGVVYKLHPTGHETVLYRFTGGTDGSQPYAGVILDSAGNLYGTTPFGGTAGNGVVYKLDPTGHETVLYSFSGGADGGRPYAGVIRDSAGNLYGTTYLGGTANAGVVYKLDPAGNETVLHRFTGGADGNNPYAGVIRDSAGNLYGTTYGGVVYKLDPAGNVTVLHSFTGADGFFISAGVIRDAAGNLYGTASRGGSGDAGVVYKVDAAGVYKVLYNFTGGADGGDPIAGVMRDATRGNLYGTTSSGGKWGTGVVFEIR
jgi:uncharacterized repeat protein (TIGR03803 family)